eukprot:m.289059 g.289059  ORF g.289059 m.289059 type:complete len:509 (-) comp27102_c1_seq2:1290-2816(-)
MSRTVTIIAIAVATSHCTSSVDGCCLARFVRIFGPSGRIINLDEVRPYDCTGAFITPVSASLSTTINDNANPTVPINCGAGKCIDSARNGNRQCSDPAASMCHSREGDPSPALTIELATAGFVNIAGAIVINRDNSGTLDRIVNFSIGLFDQTGAFSSTSQVGQLHVFRTPLLEYNFTFPCTPTVTITGNPTVSPTGSPHHPPTHLPTNIPTTAFPTGSPSRTPTTDSPSTAPTVGPSGAPLAAPTATPSAAPTVAPTSVPTPLPTPRPTSSPTSLPTASPTDSPTQMPTAAPTAPPSQAPTPDSTSASTSGGGGVSVAIIVIVVVVAITVLLCGAIFVAHNRKRRQNNPQLYPNPTFSRTESPLQAKAGGPPRSAVRRGTQGGPSGPRDNSDYLVVSGDGVQYAVPLASATASATGTAPVYLIPFDGVPIEGVTLDADLYVAPGATGTPNQYAVFRSDVLQEGITLDADHYVAPSTTRTSTQYEIPSPIEAANHYASFKPEETITKV